MFSINTNIASLVAQNNLAASSTLQGNTVAQVSSGLRITQSGTDAAGLAIANGYRSDEAVLTQGIRNAGDGQGQLQTIDGGLNNISQLLDRARTLATQSASGTFASGDAGRVTLNAEFQSVLQEIDRQAQSIGLNSGGQFATNLSVFIGGGRSQGSINSTANGSVSVDLSNSAVDAKSLGLQGVQVAGKAGVDLSTGQATSVANILSNATNVSSEAAAGNTVFKIAGPGFSDGNKISLSVNLNGVTDTTSLANAVNAAIQAAGSAGTQFATAFKNANINATVVTDAAGGQHLAFNSSNTAFQVQAGDRTANALLGNVSSGTTGAALVSTVTGSVATAAAGASFANNVTIRFQGAGLSGPIDLQLPSSDATVGAAITDLTAQVAGNASLRQAGITVTAGTAGSALVFSSSSGEKFTVQASGDTTNALGLGSALAGAGSAVSYTSIAAGAAYVDTVTKTGTASFEFSFNGGASSANSISALLTAGDAVSGTSGRTPADLVSALNAAINLNTALSSAGLVASQSGGVISFSSNNGTAFQVTSTGTNVGFGAAGQTFAGNASSSATSATFDASGANQLGVLAGGVATGQALGFNAIAYGSDTQSLTINATGPGGNAAPLTISLGNNATSGVQNAATIDQAIATINTALQKSNVATLQSIVAVKDDSSGTEKINFLSGTSTFQVSVGTTATGTGGVTATNSLGSQAQGLNAGSQVIGTGGNTDISNQSSAQAAVTALSNAVTALGNSQAVVGRGQNQFTYAANLAQSQLTNETAAESQIRDANLAQASANLTKAQILLQAGVAALSQANSAPQALLTLLQAH